MTEIVLWVDSLQQAGEFYSQLLSLQVTVDSPGYVQLASLDHKVHLHEVPVEYRGKQSDYPVRESAAIKPVFSVSSIEEAIDRVTELARMGNRFEHDGIAMQDVTDPEGNVIQIAAAKR